MSGKMMYLWESDIQESVVFKPIEIGGKKGRKKMKKTNAAIYIPNMGADIFEKICNEKGLQFVYVEVPPHGRLIDADAYEEILRGLGSRDYRREKGTICDAIKFLHPHYAPTIIEASEQESEPSE